MYYNIDYRDLSTLYNVSNYHKILTLMSDKEES